MVPEQENGPMPDQAQPAGPVPGQAAGQMQDASPEEQEEYDVFVGNGMKLLYSPKAFPKIVEMLQPDEGQDPRETLATATATIVMRVIQSAEQSGRQISGDVMLHGGTELFEELADIATKIGAHDFANDPDAMEGALFAAMDQVRAMMQGSGKIDDKAAKEEFGRMQQMSESGELETMFRGLAKGGSTPARPAPREPAGLAMAAGVQ